VGIGARAEWEAGAHAESILTRHAMWLDTYLDEANLHYCKPTVPLLEVKNNADDIYNKKRQ